MTIQTKFNWWDTFSQLIVDFYQNNQLAALSNEFSPIKNVFILIARIEKLRLAKALSQHIRTGLLQREVNNLKRDYLEFIVVIGLFHLLDDGVFPYDRKLIDQILEAIPPNLRKEILSKTLDLFFSQEEDTFIDYNQERDIEEDFSRIKLILKSWLK